jgi:hypothetical protein
MLTGGHIREGEGQKKEVKKVNMVDVLSYKNEYRSSKLVETTIRTVVRQKKEKQRR